MLKEFKEFIARGNAIDLAVGLVLGTAFGAVVTSLVEQLIMPVVGVLVRGVDFTNLFVVLDEGTPAGPYATLEAAQAAGAVTLGYGLFVNTVVTFLIIGFAVFLVVRTINKLRRTDRAPAPDMTECRYCFTAIPIKATRCPACTSDLR